MLRVALVENFDPSVYPEMVELPADEKVQPGVLDGTSRLSRASNVGRWLTGFRWPLSARPRTGRVLLMRDFT
jgi:hypothetical protein